ncbi:hypothetical protein ABDB91_08360 [Desulfoscipio sp. XC116]|uniref:hypothetical protein n=1 Tax=Desulfoscipio sp. XC116 TaxID=3144975 RepID=UPI00325B55FF
MSEVRVIRSNNGAGRDDKTVYIDNTPNIGDISGEVFLTNIEQAIDECRGLLNQGYRLTSFWTDQDKGVEFVLRPNPNKIKKL